MTLDVHRWRSGRPPRRYGWDTRAAIIAASGRTRWALDRAIERGMVDLHDLRSVARWICGVRRGRGRG